MQYQIFNLKRHQIKMKEQENPFDALASNILKHLGKQNGKELEKSLQQNPSEINLEKILDEDFFPNFRHSRTGKTLAAPISKQLEQELNDLMKYYEKSATQMSLKEFQKQVNRWELRVEKSKIGQEDRDALLAQGALAKHFSQFWT